MPRHVTGSSAMTKVIGFKWTSTKRLMREHPSTTTSAVSAEAVCGADSKVGDRISSSASGELFTEGADSNVRFSTCCSGGGGTGAVSSGKGFEAGISSSFDVRVEYTCLFLWVALRG